MTELDFSNTMIDFEKDKERVIKKLSGDRFLHENWNAGYCANYERWRYKYIKLEIIGWCKSSQVFFRQRSDDECIAIMLEDNTWCHFPLWMIKDNETNLYDYSDYYKFEGLMNF